MEVLIILMQVTAYILFALAGFLTLCGFKLGTFDNAERALVAFIDLGLVAFGSVLLIGSTRMGI